VSELASALDTHTEVFLRLLIPLKPVPTWDLVYAFSLPYKWCKEFESSQVNVKDEQRSGQSSTSADPVQDFDAAVQ
jgi:hypothetical protein